MSIAAVKWARALDLCRSAKAVLIVLAERADGKGFCFPSFETIAADLSISRLDREFLYRQNERFAEAMRRALAC
jgi:hypothetical protein